MEDGHISRVLKNWALNQQPSKQLRERILEVAAASEAVPQENPSFLRMFDFLTPGIVHFTPDLLRQVPFSQSRFWSFQFATSWRVAN